MSKSEAFAPLRLVARDLACSRAGRMVFAALSFEVSSGQVLAVTGRNGAGKSSLLRLIAGLLGPEAGSIELEGRGEDDAPVHYFGHADGLKPALTLAETLRFWATVYQQGRAALDADLNEAVEAVGLSHALDLPVRVLSAGQRRRAALARLLLAPRPLWLLDEPTAALDSAGETLLAGLMSDHIGRGGLIVAATHQALPLAPHASLQLGAA